MKLQTKKKSVESIKETGLVYINHLMICKCQTLPCYNNQNSFVALTVMAWPSSAEGLA